MRGSPVRFAKRRARIRLPVLYDVMGEVSTVELLATEYPDVTFIIPHLGSFADDWRAQLAVDRPSGASSQCLHRYLWHPALRPARAGPASGPVRKKILFGSDGPWLHPAVELAKVRALGMQEADEKLVLAGNFLRLIARVRKRPGMIRRAAVQGAMSAEETGSDPWLTSESPSTSRQKKKSDTL